MTSAPGSATRSMPTIFLTVFLDLLGLTLIIPILAPLLIDGFDILGEEVGDATRNLTYGLVIGIFSICQFFGAPVLGALSDRIGRKKVLFLTLLGTLAGYLLLALAISTSNLWLLLIGRAVQGLAAGNLSVIYSAIADISQPADKAKNFGLVGVAFGLGFIIGPVMGGVLSNHELVPWFSFVTPFLTSALLVLVNLGMVYARFPETNKRLNPDAKIAVFSGIVSLRKAFGNPQLRAIFVVVFFFIFGFTFFTQFIQVYLIRKFSFKQDDIGYLFGYIGFVIAFTQGVLVRYLSGRVAPAHIIRVSLFLLSGAFLILLIPDKTLGLYLLMPLVAINQGLANPNISAMVSNMAPAHLQGETLGMQQSVQALAQIVPPLIGGVALNFSVSSPLWLGAAATLMAWLAFVLQFGIRKVWVQPEKKSGSEGE